MKFLLFVLALASPLFAEDVMRTRIMGVHTNVIVPEAPIDHAEYVAIEKTALKYMHDNGYSSAAQRAPRNPECCIWIKLWSGEKNAYLLRIAPSGVHLTVGSVEALNSALACLNKVRLKGANDDWTYPVAAFSNAEFQKITPDYEKKTGVGETTLWPTNMPTLMHDPKQVDRLTREMKPIVNALARDFGWKDVEHVGANPETGLWVEPWAYSKKTWVLRIQKQGGAHMVAGSEDALKEALAFIRKNAKKTEQGWHLPVGNFTNLTVRKPAAEKEN